MLHDKPITKRQLGLFLVVAGALAAVGLLLIDRLGVGGYVGLGPVQSLALRVSLGVMLLGGSLLPLKDRPA